MSHPSGHRFRPRLGIVTVLLLPALAGCGSAEPAPRPAGTAAETSTAGAAPTAGSGTAPAAGAGAGGSAEPTLMSLITLYIAELDRQLELNCPCLMQMGAYDTVEDCLMWQHSRPDWVPCSVSALKPYDSPETREVFSCMYQVLKEGGECIATKSCDPVERAECGGSPLQCVGERSDAVLALVSACPDLALLMRQQ